MKILVTGANGFVGTQLCRLLLERGHSVTAVVRKSGSAPIGTHELVVPDIGSDTDWAGHLVGQNAIIHLAARVHVMQETSADPLTEFREVNRRGTENLGRASAASDVQQFVFLSSIKVNGEETAEAPFDAQSVPAPLDPYGVSKFEAEQDLRLLEADSAMGVVIIRTPLVFGPGVGGNFLRMLGMARRNVPLPLASVRNRRSMVSIWNLCDLLERAASDPAASGALVIAGDTQSPSTPELLRMIGRASGNEARLVKFPVPLLTRVATLLGKGSEIHRLVSSLEVEAGSTSNGWQWVPTVEFEEALERTVVWYRESMDNREGEPTP